MGPILSVVVLLLSSSGFAKPVTVKEAYYGADFFRSSTVATLQKQTLKIDRRLQLRKILRGVHNPTPGGFDIINESCTVKNCYQHLNLGYDAARRLILGRFYLVPLKSGYGIKDVYCDRVMEPQEFRHSRPGPGVVPDNGVINVEHTWPQSKFSREFWKDEQKADLHHLFPTNSRLNSMRSSYPFGEVETRKSTLDCDNSELGYTRDREEIHFEPPPPHKGNVARAIFYFSVRYNLPISPSEESFLREWHEQDPVDEDEVKRNEEIFALQRSRNPFIDYPELAKEVADF